MVKPKPVPGVNPDPLFPVPEDAPEAEGEGEAGTDPDPGANPLLPRASGPGGRYMPFNDGGTPKVVVPETPRDVSLLQKFAAFDEDTRARLLKFEEGRHDLETAIGNLDQATSYPDDYDDLIRSLLRKV
jgi:hypothetical protein